MARESDMKNLLVEGQGFRPFHPQGGFSAQMRPACDQPVVSCFFRKTMKKILNRPNIHAKHEHRPQRMRSTVPDGHPPPGLYCLVFLAFSFLRGQCEKWIPLPLPLMHYFITDLSQNEHSLKFHTWPWLGKIPKKVNDFRYLGKILALGRFCRQKYFYNFFGFSVFLLLRGYWFSRLSRSAMSSRSPWTSLKASTTLGSNSVPAPSEIILWASS